jgi:hypothetical protein
MRRQWKPWLCLFAVPLLTACSGARPPLAPDAATSTASQEPQVGTVTAQGWGPETPPFNIEVILRGDPGFGHVKFRQPNDSSKIVYLDTWIRDLKASTAYRLQRAVDPVPDGSCTSAGWLTLGLGPVPEDIVTDERGTGSASLWRDLSAVATGTRFDIHFRVIEAATGAVALESGCYQFVVDM